MALTSQQTFTAALANTLGLGGTIIARGRRNTNSTAASAAQGVLRVDGIALTSGRLYAVYTSSLLSIITVAADTHTIRMSYATGGSTATTASTFLAGVNLDAFAGTGGGNGVSPVSPLLGWIAGAGTTTASILLWHQRLTGTGTIALNGTFGAGIDLVVVDHGVDPGDTGVDL